MSEPLCIRRTWIDIDLDQVIANYRAACGITSATVTCVLKANAYGHGLCRIAETLHEAGCRSFAVSCAREALCLRHHGLQDELLVMGQSEPECLDDLIRTGVILTAAAPEDIEALESAAASIGMMAHVHVKVDTGFHRLGFSADESGADAIASTLQKAPHVSPDGLYSHLGLISKERDQAQHDALMTMVQRLAARGVHPQDIHLCDSIGLARYPMWHMSRVRVGAWLFGSRPASSAPEVPCGETLAFRTKVAQLHTVRAGEPVGYSDDEVLTRDSIVATLCAGYGDGYPRHLSYGRGKVMIHGQPAPVIGLVCMDQMMVDVTDIPGVQPGDTADLLGGSLPYQAVADMAGTNRNECLTILSARPVRVYHQSGRVMAVDDRLLDD